MLGLAEMFEDLKNMKPAKRWRIFHAIMIVVWILLIIPTIVIWAQSILWVAFMSVYAIIMAHWSAYQAARAEKKADPEDDSDDMI